MLKLFMIISLFIGFPLFADELEDIKNTIPEIELSALVAVLKTDGTLIISDQTMDMKIHTLHYKITLDGYEIPNFYKPKTDWTPVVIAGGIGLVVGLIIGFIE